MIKWNSGLSLGIKELDDDHKKLLSIINRLSEEIENDKAQDVIYAIFAELESYSKEHCRREEDLLRECNYKDLDEHIEKHNAFAEKIPELKVKLLKSKDAKFEKEVVSFLIDWLLEHIIDEDIPLISVFEECGVCEKKIETPSSWFKKLIDKATDTFSFTNRLLLSALIPLGGMLALILIILMSNYYKNEEMLKTSTITNMLSSINNLAHVMQKERGLSCGYLSSSDDKFKNNLYKQREIVDDAIELFNNKIKTIDKSRIVNIKENIDTYKRDIVTLDNFRKSLEKKEVSQNRVIDYYTKIIKNILDTTSKISMLELNSQLSSSIATLASLLYYKDTLGLKRAMGTAILEHNGEVKNDMIRFIQYSANQKVFLDTFNRTATKAQKSSLNDILNSDIAKKIKFYETKLQSSDLGDIDSVVWFDSMSKLIDRVKLFENRLLEEIEAVIKKRLEENLKTLFLWLIYTTIIFLSTIILVYIFAKSSKDELYSFIEAIKDLAQGGRDLRLTHHKKKDEIAELYSAYELTRHKLLKADIYIQLYLDKKELEIKEQQKKNLELEEMASIDPLTGCINRRKFDELSNLELSRAIRYKSDVSFLMLDIDHFKSVNDRYGHGVGDEVLKHFSSICMGLARDLDIVARVGGEEFVVILPQTDSDGAFIFAERFRKKIADSSVSVGVHTIKYSVSIGIAYLDKSSKDVATILQKADKALYAAKKSGRDKTVIYSDKIS